jgi:hypothetical protein
VANSPQAQAETIHPFLESAIKEMDNGPDVFYYLATHLAACESECTLFNSKLAIFPFQV